MTVFRPALLTGVVVLLAGAALPRHREPVARTTSAMQQQMSGDGAMVRRGVLRLRAFVAQTPPSMSTKP